MKRLALTLAVAGALSLPLAASASEWSFDQDHADLGFEVAHLGVSKVKGEFTNFNGKAEIPDGDFTKADLWVEVKTDSINTDNEKRDTHLRSGDFLLAEKHPTITFKSKKIKKAKGKNAYTIVGDLTIRGETREVTLDATLTDPVSAWGTRRGLAGKTTINRNDWGVSWNKKFDKGVLLVGNEVDLWFDVELIEKADDKKG